jgi:hypothetical protein
VESRLTIFVMMMLYICPPSKINISAQFRIYWGENLMPFTARTSHLNASVTSSFSPVTCPIYYTNMRLIEIIHHLYLWHLQNFLVGMLQDSAFIMDWYALLFYDVIYRIVKYQFKTCGERVQQAPCW